MGQTYKLDRNLLIIEQICPLENNAKRALADFLSHPVMYPDNVRG